MRTGRPPRPLIERFFEKINKSAPNGCWEWTGCLCLGYGLIKRKDGLHLRAHRVSWEYHRGMIPHGMFICHSCDNRKCVNPDHLFVGTHNDNMKDMVIKGRSAKTVGEMNGFHKLKTESIETIRNDRRPQHIIAKDYGVCQTTISLIKRGKRWGWLS